MSVVSGTAAAALTQMGKPLPSQLRLEWIDRSSNTYQIQPWAFRMGRLGGWHSWHNVLAYRITDPVTGEVTDEDNWGLRAEAIKIASQNKTGPEIKGPERA